MGLYVIVCREPIYIVFSFRETHMTTLELLHLKQRRRVLTEKLLSITLGICKLSLIKLTL